MNTKKYVLLPALAVLLLPLTAAITLEGVSTNPAFLSSGSEATLAVTLFRESTDDDQRGRLRAELVPDNHLSERYIRVDRTRDQTIGYLPEGESYTLKYDVYIDGNAPTGTYRFQLRIQDGGTGTTIQKPFTVNVEKDGISLDATLIQTEPNTLRPGDTDAHATIRFTNTGEQPVEDIVLTPNYPDGVTPLYSSDEKFRVARLETGQHNDIEIGLDIAKDAVPGRQTLSVIAAYEDTDQNDYDDAYQVPLRIEGRPILRVADTDMRVAAGATAEMRFTVENTGVQDAEGVEARLILQEGQPFTPEDRSVYIGRLTPNESRTASFTVTTPRTARQGSHGVEIELRSTGDFDEGDTNVYVERESAVFTVEGTTRSPLIPVGVVAALLIATYGVYSFKKRGGSA